MAYVGKINEQDPQNLYPAVNADPSFGERMKYGIQMDFPNASIGGAANALKNAAMVTPEGQLYQTGKQILSSAQNVRDARQPYPMTESGGGAGNPPVGPARAKLAGDVLPANLPPAPPRNYLAEVEAQDKKFNAIRDTPRQPDFQTNYVPPTGQPAQANPWVEEQPRDPSMQVNRWLQQDAAAGKYPDSAQNLANHEKQMMQQVRSMLPGASPKEVRSIMNTISQTVKPQAQAAGPQSLQGVINAATAEKPSYQKLSAGQSIYQMNPDGTAKHITTAPGGAAEGRADAKFNNQQKTSVNLWAPIKKEYNAQWDKITQDVTDPVEKEKALRALNVQHFRSLGVPDDLAEVPVSFKSFKDDYLLTQPGGAKLTREKTNQLAIQHQQYNKLRNRLLEMKFGNTLKFNSSAESQ